MLLQPQTLEHFSHTAEFLFVPTNETELTLPQVRALSKRFKVSAAVFV